MHNKRSLPRKWTRFVPFIVGILLLVLPKVQHYAQGATANITVNFTNTIRTLSPLAFGMDVSGYGMGGINIVSDQLQKTRMSALRMGLLRIDLHYSTSGDPTSKIICGASGCDTGKTGDQWVTSIKSIGAQPIVIVPLNVTDATNLVKHFNVTTNNRVNYFIVGNEPDNAGINANTYANTFNAIYDSMKAVDPKIQIGGPATASFNTAYLQTFLTISGSRTDFVDYHSYGEGGPVVQTEAQLLANTASYTSNANTLRTMIQNTVPARASQIIIHLGEWNLSWSGDSKTYTNFNTVWASSALGHQLLAGDWSSQYADKNGGLGALYDQNDSTHDAQLDDPMPIYHGLGMFTGEGHFPGFGATLVSASTTLNNIEVFASNYPKNIVVVNKDPSLSQTLNLTTVGVTSGTADVWQKNQSSNPIAAPVQLATLPLANGSFSYTVPPYSVTTFVMSGPNPAATL